MSIPRARGTLHPEAVFQIFKFQIVHKHRPHMAQAVVFRKRNFRDWLLLVGLEEHECASRRVGAEDGKIHTAGHMTHAEWQQVTATHAEVANLLKSCRRRIHRARIVISKHGIASIGCVAAQEIETQITMLVFYAC